MNPGENITLADVIDAAVLARLADVHTCLPGYVVSYDSATQKATVQPILRAGVLDDDGNVQAVKVPAIPSVPVCFPSASGYAITFDLSPGDPVVLVVSERSTAEWRSTGRADITPQDLRRFDLSDAYAIPGGRSFASPVSPAPGGGVASGSMVLLAPGILLTSNAAIQRYVLGDALLTALQAAIPEWVAACTALGIPSTQSAALLAGIGTSLSGAGAPYLSAKIKGA